MSSRPNDEDFRGTPDGPGTDSARSGDREASPRPSAAEPQWGAKFTRELDWTVKREVNLREAVWIKRAKLSLLILAPLVGFLATAANIHIDRTIENHLDERVGSIQEELDLTGFLSDALRVGLRETSTSKDHDGLVDYLRTIEDNQSVRERSDFRGGLNEALISFVSAGNSSWVDEFFEKYFEEIRDLPQAQLALMNHYGQKLVARAFAPSNDVALLRFEQLEGLSAFESDFQELPIYYRCLFEHKADPAESNSAVDNLLASVARMKVESRRIFFFHLFLILDWSTWSKARTPEADEIAEVTESFLLTHGPPLAELLGTRRELNDLIEAGRYSGKREIEILLQLVPHPDENL